MIGVGQFGSRSEGDTAGYDGPVGTHFARGRSWANPVKGWTDPEKWARVTTPEGCPFCPVEPRDPYYVELPETWALIAAEGALPGYVLVVSKRHVIEPYELAPDDGARFWADCMRTAGSVASLVHPVKTNFEIHGNTVPHLHMHIFPRFVGDRFERGPIDPHGPAVRRSPEEREALRAAIANS